EPTGPCQLHSEVHLLWKGAPRDSERPCLREMRKSHRGPLRLREGGGERAKNTLKRVDSRGVAIFSSSSDKPEDPNIFPRRGGNPHTPSRKAGGDAEDDESVCKERKPQPYAIFQGPQVNSLRQQSVGVRSQGRGVHDGW